MKPMEVDLHTHSQNRTLSAFRPNLLNPAVSNPVSHASSSGSVGTSNVQSNSSDNHPLVDLISDNPIDGFETTILRPEEDFSNQPQSGFIVNAASTASISDSTMTTSQGASESPPVPSMSMTGSMTVVKSPGSHQIPANRFVYSSERHPHQTLESMNVLRKNRALCDVVLVVDGRQIYTHRVVLAACSAYFRAMFTGELAESRQTEITLYDLDPEAVETLVDFCYTSQITVEECNVQTLLPAACLLQLTEVQDVCCEFLKQQLDPSNCLGIRAFADTHACRGLLRVADRFTQLNFPEVIESEEFLLLPVKQLVTILSSDELNVRSEEQVYRAVMRWIHHNLPERRRNLAYLMQHVRLPLLSPKFLVGTVGTDMLIRADERCRDLVDEAKNYLLLPQERPLMQGPRTKPRRPIHTGELLFAVGGWCSGDAIASAEHYDSRTHDWHLVSPMHKRRCGVGVGVVNDLLYAVGGHDGQSYLNSVERYDPHTNLWSSDIAPTSTCRTSVGVAVLNDFMYAVGGQDGVSCLSFVERYDPVVNRWTKVSSMASRRLGVGVAVLDGQLYAVGGSDGQQPLSSVEHYDPRVGTWHRVSSMGTRRKHLGVTVFNGLIYAVGGRDEATELSSAECFDPRTRMWSPVVAMTSRRSGVGLAVVNNQLIAIGGFDGATYLKTVEVYDPDSNCWRLRGSMNSRRLGGGVGVIRLATNPSVLGRGESGGGGGGDPKASGLSVSVMNHPCSSSTHLLPSSLTSSVIVTSSNHVSRIPAASNVHNLSPTASTSGSLTLGRGSLGGSFLF